MSKKNQQFLSKLDLHRVASPSWLLSVVWTYSFHLGSLLSLATWQEMLLHCGNWVWVVQTRTVSMIDCLSHTRTHSHTQKWHLPALHAGGKKGDIPDDKWRSAGYHVATLARNTQTHSEFQIIYFIHVLTTSHFACVSAPITLTLFTSVLVTHSNRSVIRMSRSIRCRKEAWHWGEMAR